ncbi:trigger factor [Paenibacillus thiaminolyticus]|uniref:Trigger factor n=1 Tax=Paenibacillus thiaminolyticus TaxID=49283 RepID=A0AAP9DXT8_PANTH|nr:trigger factor [Paenibacillus thiaminolyticus]MCY9537275.1 trigger factor [Paenibacillus thiaminolyticus]MCY9600044.1 trigger factor [Paenibacillus thiaminolyticus]MCY9610502.1 trigger factor [Paenibacillus thiaminolyticus]MCY9615733.1 trigger factor [Paenibacillus thiaminolyticus]MCY9617097.1 trigger factor [Paenibacillus thiaminolyticus]
MKATWEKIEKNVGVLEVEVDAERVTEALDQAFKKVSKRVNVPGFRKGRVPRPIFEAKYGVESLYQDAIDIMLPEAYTQAVKETDIKPVDQPDVEVEQFGKGQTFKFKAKVTVKPEVQLGEYKGLEVEKQSVEVTEEELDAELKRMQERHAELIIVDEDVAATGDSVVIDFEGFVDGEGFEGGKAERYTLELGSNSFIPGFEDQLVGMGTGDFKDVEVTFPEHYHAENLAGKPAVFKVKLHEIKRKQLPVLDDEFAKDVSEFDTLEEYKADLKQQLQSRKEKEAEGAREAAVVDKAAENAEVEIPHAMIESEIQHMVKDLDNRLRMQGMNIDMFLTLSGQTIADLREQMQKEADKRVKNNLVLEQIAKEENLSVSEEELSAELDKMAEMYQRTAEEIRDILTKNGTIENLREESLIRKTIAFLVENSK